MELAQKKKLLIQQLKNYFHGDMTRVQALANDCKFIGFSLGEEKNMDAIAEKPEMFMVLMTFSDLGIISKMKKTTEELKSN